MSAHVIKLDGRHTEAPTPQQGSPCGPGSLYSAAQSSISGLGRLSPVLQILYVNRLGEMHSMCLSSSDTPTLQAATAPVREMVNAHIASALELLGCEVLQITPLGATELPMDFSALIRAPGEPSKDEGQDG